MKAIWWVISLCFKVLKNLSRKKPLLLTLERLEPPLGWPSELISWLVRELQSPWVWQVQSQWWPRWNTSDFGSNISSQVSFRSSLPGWMIEWHWVGGRDRLVRGVPLCRSLTSFSPLRLQYFWLLLTHSRSASLELFLNHLFFYCFVSLSWDQGQGLIVLSIFHFKMSLIWEGLVVHCPSLGSGFPLWYSLFHP